MANEKFFSSDLRYDRILGIGHCMSPYGTLRTGGFCLFDNKIYLIPFPPHQKALEYFCDPHLPLFAVNCPQTPPPLYTRLTTNGPPSIPPEIHVTSDQPQR